MISILYFGHYVTFIQILGIIIVFLAVFYEFAREIKTSYEKVTEKAITSEI